jgi:hypothetical protein
MDLKSLKKPLYSKLISLKTSMLMVLHNIMKEVIKNFCKKAFLHQWLKYLRDQGHNLFL